MFASYIGPEVEPVCRPLARRVLASASFNFVLTFFVSNSLEVFIHVEISISRYYGES